MMLLAVVGSSSRFYHTLGRLLQLEQRACFSPGFSKLNTIGNESDLWQAACTGGRHLQNRKTSDEELFRHGIDQSDYDFMRNPSSNNSDKSDGNSEESSEWCAYLLLSADCKKTYVGITCNVKRRLRQHNGELAGGSKAARTGRPWRLACTVHSFETRSEACQFEYHWKSLTRSMSGIKTRALDEKDSTTTTTWPMVRRRQAALEEVLNSSSKWKSLNIEWHL